MAFEIKLYQTEGDATLSLETLELKMLMIGCKWRRSHDGVAISDARGDHVGNLKPCYPDHHKVQRLQEHFRTTFADKER